MGKRLVLAGRIGPIPQEGTPPLLQGCRALTMRTADEAHQQILTHVQLINPTGLYPEILRDVQVHTLRRMFRDLIAVLPDSPFKEIQP